MFIITKVFNDGYSLEVLDTEDGKAEVIRVKDLVNYLDNGIIPLSNVSTFQKITTGEGVYSFEMKGIGEIVSKYIIKVYFGMYSARLVEEEKPAVVESTIVGVVPPEPNVDWDDTPKEENEDTESTESDAFEEDELSTDEMPVDTPAENEEGIENEKDIEVEESSGDAVVVTEEAEPAEEPKPLTDIEDVNSKTEDVTTEEETVEVEEENTEVDDGAPETEKDTSESVEDGNEVLAGVLGNLGVKNKAFGNETKAKSKDSSTGHKTSSTKETKSENTSDSVEDGSSLLESITGKTKKKSKTATSKVASKSGANVKTSARKTTFTEGKKKFLAYLSYESGSNPDEKRLAFEADLKTLAKFHIFGANDTFTNFVATCKRGKNKGKFINLVVLDDILNFRSRSDIAFKDKVLKAADRMLSGYVNIEAKASTLYKICATSVVETIDADAFVKENADNLLYTLVINVTDDKNVMNSLD